MMPMSLPSAEPMRSCSRSQRAHSRPLTLDCLGAVRLLQAPRRVVGQGLAEAAGLLLEITVSRGQFAQRLRQQGARLIGDRLLPLGGKLVGGFARLGRERDLLLVELSGESRQTPAVIFRETGGQIAGLVGEMAGVEPCRARKAASSRCNCVARALIAAHVPAPPAPRDRA